MKNHLGRTIEERFWSKVHKGDICWNWIGAKQKGYGALKVDGKLRRAHRLAYEMLIGPIPDGLGLDHLCRNRACVNPDHLEPVTTQENLRRGDGPTGTHARQAHCIHGHEFTPGNTMIRKNGTRQCRQCARAQHRKWRTKRRGGVGDRP